MSVSSDRWTCPRCQRTTVAHGTRADIVFALDAVRTRHGSAHAAGDHLLEDVGLAGASARATSKARRADSRAAARRRANRQQTRSA